MLSSEDSCWIWKHEEDICAESENMKKIFVRYKYESEDERRKEKKKTEKRKYSTSNIADCCNM